MIMKNIKLILLILLGLFVLIDLILRTGIALDKDQEAVSYIKDIRNKTLKCSVVDNRLEYKQINIPIGKAS